MQIEYKGYIVTQDELNWHVMISKNGRMVMHSQCNKLLSADELCSMVDDYISMKGAVGNGYVIWHLWASVSCSVTKLYDVPIGKADAKRSV